MHPLVLKISEDTYGLFIRLARGVRSFFKCKPTELLQGLRLVPGTHGLVLIRLRCLGDIRLEFTTTTSVILFGSAVDVGF